MLQTTIKNKRKNIGCAKDEDYVIGVGPPPCGKTKKGQWKKISIPEITNNK